MDSRQEPDAWGADTRPERSRPVDSLGVAVFALCLVSLLAFERAPLASYSGPAGSEVNFDLLSLAGFVGAVLGILLVVRLLKQGLRPWSVQRTLGVIGTVVLLAHATVAIASPRPPDGPAAVPPGTRGLQALERRGPEVWEIDEQSYQVSSTYYLRLPGGLQYTIEYPYEFGSGGAEMSDVEALAVVFPLMEHALREGLYDRLTLTKIGSGGVPVSRIGVALVEQLPGGLVHGYRVGLALEEIRRRMTAGE